MHGQLQPANLGAALVPLLNFQPVASSTPSAAAAPPAPPPSIKAKADDSSDEDDRPLSERRVKVHASALPRAGTTPPPHSPSEAAADAAGAAAWRRHLLLSPELRRYAERARVLDVREQLQEIRRSQATPHRTTADRRQDRRRSPRGTPHGGGPKGDTPPHA